MNKKAKQRKLSRKELREMMEQKLKAKTVPSGKVYRRNRKHKKGDNS